MTTTAVDFLTYEEELEICDRLVERRAVRDALKAEGLDGPRDAEEARVLEAGNSAAQRLVECYLPFLHSLAHGVHLNTDQRGNQVSVDDLIQTGALAMMTCTNAYDARGKRRHDPTAYSGVRFGEYCKMHVLREMRRLVAKMSTGVTANVDVIQATWAFLAVRAELEANLGRQPTDAEVEAASDINSDYIVRHLPSRVGMLDVADDNVANDAAFEAVIAALDDSEVMNGVLERTMRSAMNPELVTVMLALFGVDLGVPRSVTEATRYLDSVHPDLRLRRKDVAYYEEFGYDVLRHPQVRAKMHAALMEVRASGVDI